MLKKISHGLPAWTAMSVTKTISRMCSILGDSENTGCYNITVASMIKGSFPLRLFITIFLYYEHQYGWRVFYAKTILMKHGPNYPLINANITV